MLEVHKIETFGALDGPGLRTVIFLQGCPMRCVYCHNKGSWHRGEGKLMTEDALMEIIMRNRPYTRKNGGVTFSGGEPLFQAKALLPLVVRLREAGIHTALDTSGCIYEPDVLKVLDTVDLVILDIKANTDSAFRNLTGQGMANTLAVLSHLKKQGMAYWIRQVDYPGIMGTEAGDHEKLDQLTQSVHRKRLERLPYHTMGETVIKT